MTIDEEVNIVWARRTKGLDIPVWRWLFGIKISYGCGNCSFTQETKVPYTNYPLVPCSKCKTLNKIPITKDNSYLGFL